MQYLTSALSDEDEQADNVSVGERELYSTEVNSLEFVFGTESTPWT